MASPSFPPTPAQPPMAPGGAPGGAPNPIGQAVSSGKPPAGNLIQRLGTSLQDIKMFADQIGKQKPEVAAKINQNIMGIISALKELATGQGGPGSAQPTVPSPPQPGASPQPPSPAETPEAT